DTVLKIQSNRYRVPRQSIEDAARLLRGPPLKAIAPESLPVLPGRLNFIYAYAGAPDRMMEYPERALETGMATFIRSLFDPLHAPLRKTERFKAFVRKSGLVDYWRARGWPDHCRPVGADDF